MPAETGMQMYPYWAEGYKLLREKYKFGAQEANKLVIQVWSRFFRMEETPKAKNARRLFLHALRGAATRERRGQKRWVQGVKRHLENRGK